MTHCLKVWPEYFTDLNNRDKNFEIRKNDREFKAGDYLILQEYDPETFLYTGKEIRREIVCLYNNAPGVFKNYVAMEIKDPEVF